MCCQHPFRGARRSLPPGPRLPGLTVTIWLTALTITVEEMNGDFTLQLHVLVLGLCQLQV